MQKVALITGVSGQDGSYLADLLLSKGYIVYGIKRKASSFNTQRVDHLVSNVNFHLVYAHHAPEYRINSTGTGT